MKIPLIQSPGLLVLIILIIVLSNRNTYAENNRPKTNSIEGLFEKANAFKGVSTDSLLYYARQGFMRAADNDNFLKGQFAFMLARNYYFQLSEYDSALKYSPIAAEQFLMADSIKQYLNATRVHGYVLLASGNYNQAIKKHLHIIKVSDSLGLIAPKAIALNNIGEVYRLQKNGPKALSYLKQASDVIEQTDDEPGKLTISLNLALAYDLNGNTEKAIVLYQNNLRNSKVMRSIDTALIYHNLGRLYQKEGKFEVAKQYIDSSMSIAVWRQSDKKITASYKELVSIYNGMGKPNTSLNFALKLYQLAHKTGNLNDIEDATRNLSDTYELLHEYESSLKYQKEYAKTIWDIFDSETNRLIAEMDAKYQTAEKEKQLLVSENKRVIAERAKRNLFIGLFMIIIISVLMLLLLRQRIQKKEVAIKLKQSHLDLKEKELQVKREQLAGFKRLIQEKNKLLEELSNSSDHKIEYLDKLSKSIILTDSDWQSFKSVFEQVHENFFTRMRYKYPDFTENDVRMVSLMKLNLSNKEISNMLGISSESVIKAKYRLKKKIQLQEEQKLETFVSAL